MAKQESSKTETASDNNKEAEHFELKREYDELIDRLKYHRDQLEDEIKKDYYDARRYVRSHPEEGVLISFAGGLLLGIILGNLSRK